MKVLEFKINCDNIHSTITNYASHIVYEASKFMSDMKITVDNSTVDLKSILGVVSIGMSEGKNASITIEGEEN